MKVTPKSVLNVDSSRMSQKTDNSAGMKKKSLGITQITTRTNLSQLGMF